MELLEIKSQLDSTTTNLVEEERKSYELREFISNLMKQKEDIIKKELEKSETLLTYETDIQSLKHERESLEDQFKKTKNSEQNLKEAVKRLSKELKEQQGEKAEEHHKGEKLLERIRERERQMAIRDQTITRLQERLKN